MAEIMWCCKGKEDAEESTISIDKYLNLTITGVENNWERKYGGLRGRREPPRGCRRPADWTSFPLYLERVRVIRPRLLLKRLNKWWQRCRVGWKPLPSPVWLMHGCGEMVERRCEWMREIYSYLFSGRTEARQSHVSCWWDANHIHFFPSSSSLGKTLAALSLPYPIIPFWLETHNQIWSHTDVFYQVTPVNIFAAREAFFYIYNLVGTLLGGYLLLYRWFIADHDSEMFLSLFWAHYLALWRLCHLNLLTFCWLWASLMVFLEQKPLTVTQTSDNRLIVSLWEAISVGLRRRNQLRVLRKWPRTMIRRFLLQGWWPWWNRLSRNGFHKTKTAEKQTKQNSWWNILQTLDQLKGERWWFFLYLMINTT